MNSFWLVLGSTVGALGGQQFTKMASAIDTKISIERSWIRGGPGTKEIPVLVARRGLRGEVISPPGGEEVRK